MGKEAEGCFEEGIRRTKSEYGWDDNGPGS
jgi:hypothetical protein